MCARSRDRRDIPECRPERLPQLVRDGSWQFSGEETN